MEKPQRLTGKQLEDAVNTNGKKIERGINAKATVARKNGGMPKTGKPKEKKEAPWIKLPPAKLEVVEIPAHPAAAGGGSGEEPPESELSNPDIPHHLRGFKDAVRTAHEALQAKLAQEKLDESESQDSEAIKESIETLHEAARQAQQEGRGEDAKKLGEVIRELSKMQRGQSNEPTLTRHQFGSKAERVQEPPMEVESQVDEHDILEKDNAVLKEQEVWDKERSDEDSNLADSDARIHGLRDELDKQEREKEAMDLLKQLAARSKEPKETTGEETPASAWEQHYKDEQEEFRKANPPQETTPEQWAEHYKEADAAKKNAEAYGFSVSVEKLTKDIQITIQEGGERIEQNTPNEHKGFLRNLAERYRTIPTKYKVIFGGLLLSGAALSAFVTGPASAMTLGFWVAQRAMSGIGAAVATDGMTERMKTRYAAGALTMGAGIAALFLPSFIQHMDQNYLHIGDTLRDYFGFNKGKTVTNTGAKTDKILPYFTDRIPTVPGFVENLFDHPFLVGKDNDVWNLLKAKLEEGNIINSSMSEGEVNRKLAILQNKLAALGSDGIKDILHIRSGNIHLIRPGETIDFSIIDKKGWLNEIK